MTGKMNGLTPFRKRLVAAGMVLALALLVGQALPAFAHANLISSDPPAGAVLAASPASIVLDFSEEVDPALATLRLVDADNREVPVGPAVIDPASPRQLQLELPPLPESAYNAVWQVRSLVDGHITYGSVPFSVGRGLPPVGLLPAPGAPTPASAGPALADTLLRWGTFLAAALLAGSMLFPVLVWKPAYASVVSPPAVTKASGVPGVRWLAQAGLAGMVFFSVTALLYQAHSTAFALPEVGFRAALVQLLWSRSGGFLFIRLILAGLLWLQLHRLVSPGAPGGELAEPRVSSRSWLAAAGLAALLLLTISLQSHSAALASPLAIAADFLHLLAMSAWIGGLLPLALVLRSGEVPASILVPRFSRVALASVAILALSGLALAYLHVGTLEALAATLYGRVLSVKTVLFGLLVALGALNLLALTPRLASPGSKGLRWLRRTLRAELLLGALVLLASGVLAGVSPAFEALVAERRLGYAGSVRQGGMSLSLWVAPRLAGYNEIAVDISGVGRQPAGSEAEVILRASMRDHDMGVMQVQALPLGGRRYGVQGSHLAMAGNWEVEVIVRRPGANDVRHTFSLRVEAPEQDAFPPNPVPAEAQSIVAGQALYEQHCLLCHGPAGKGDGPAARALNPPPADLSVHAQLGVHSDGQLFEWIYHGIPGTPMPAFNEVLAEIDAWHLVNYIRQLAP